MARGKIISIEGSDSSGKETQTRMLHEKLNGEGYKCEMMSFPRYDTPTGRIVGQCYLGKEGLGKGDVAWFGDPVKVNPIIASLYYAADRHAAHKEISEIVDSGTHLILDRWVDSNKIHQASKETIFKKRREITNFIEDLEYGLLELMRPDMTIFLHMPLDIIRKLSGERGNLDLHEKNFEYLDTVNEYVETSLELWNFININCVSNEQRTSLKSPEEIHEEIYAKVIDIINT